MSNEKKSQEQITLEIMNELMGQLSFRIIDAPDKNVNDFADVMLADIKYLQPKGQNSCFKFLFPHVDGRSQSSSLMLSVNLGKMLDIYNDLFIASYNADVPVDKNEQIIASDLEQLMDNLFLKYGSNIEQLANPAAANVDRQLVCGITIDFYTEIMALPEDWAAQQLKFLLSGGQ